MTKRFFVLITAILISTATAFAQGGTTGPLTWNISNGILTISSKVSQAFGVNAIPTNLLIDPEGKIVARNVFGSELHDLIYKVFDND